MTTLVITPCMVGQLASLHRSYTVPPQVEVGSLHIFVSHFVVNLPTAMESPLDPKQYVGAYFNDSQRQATIKNKGKQRARVEEEPEEEDNEQDDEDAHGEQDEGEEAVFEVTNDCV
jgi:hypothetical protein